MELDKIREYKKIAEKAIETIIAEYEIQTGTCVQEVMLIQDVVMMINADKYNRSIRLEVKL